MVTAELVKLDLGSGPHPIEGFSGVDSLDFGPNVTKVDLGGERWPWADGSVSEAHASHVIEHLTATQRIHFCNELYRVLVDGGTCRIQVPHWSSARAYGDLTHQWPPVSEAWFAYLGRMWRSLYAPHADWTNNRDGYMCDFDVSIVPVFTEAVAVRYPEYQQFAQMHYTNAIDDLVAVLTKR